MTAEDLVWRRKAAGHDRDTILREVSTQHQISRALVACYWDEAPEVGSGTQRANTPSGSTSVAKTALVQVNTGGAGLPSSPPPPRAPQEDV